MIIGLFKVPKKHSEANPQPKQVLNGMPIVYILSEKSEIRISNSTHLWHSSQSESWMFFTKNPKQIRIIKFLMLKTQKHSIQTRHIQVVLNVFSKLISCDRTAQLESEYKKYSNAQKISVVLLRSFNFENLNFDIVSNFVFRHSNLYFRCFFYMAEDLLRKGQMNTNR